MGAVRLRVRVEFRRHAWSWVALAIIVGIVGGSVLALAAGARRTETAYSRFLDRYPASDFVIADSGDFGFGGSFDLTPIARLPEVATSSRLTALTPIAVTTGDGRELLGTSIVPFADQDGNLGRRVEAWKLVDGRRANPDRADEVVVGFAFARDQDLGVGSTLRVEVIRQERLLTRAAAVLPCLTDQLAYGCKLDIDG